MKQETDNRLIAAGGEHDIMHHLGGYHRCCLGDPMHLEFAGKNFCEMLGYQETELAELTGEVYTALVHPDDTALFDDFAQRLAENEGCDSVVYRLIRRDGSVIRVVDTMASVVCEDGVIRGYSVVCEVPDDQLESASTVPGERMAILKVYGNAAVGIERMCGVASSLLGVKDSHSSTGGLLDFIAISDRVKVRKAIDKAHVEEYSDMETCALISADGETQVCDLWVECIQLEESVEDSLFCIKIEGDIEHQRNSEDKLSFGRLLFSSFAEDLFEVDRLEGSVTYIARSDNGIINLPLNVRMFMDDTTKYLIDHVEPEDIVAARDFCEKVTSGNPESGDIESAKLKFSVVFRDGSVRPALLTMASISRAKCFIGLSFDHADAGGDPLSTVATQKQINVALFGSFRLVVDGKAVNIRSAKAKELLALLIERRGAFVSTREIIAMLWECEPDETTRARARKVASRLMSELNRNGIGYIVESDRGARRVIAEYIECDYYDYRDGLRGPSGDFLPEYSWAEYVRID